MSEIDAIIRAHTLRSAHRCSCGWEGDSATTHVVDALGLDPAVSQWNCSARCWREGGPHDDRCSVTHFYEVTGRPA